MKRRELLKQSAAASAVIITGCNPLQATVTTNNLKRKRVLRAAHITDVHIRPEFNAPVRFRQCLDEIKKHKPDFFLNGGDTIYAADYADITRDRVLEQWDTWEKCTKDIKDFEIYSCLGNHDMWWAAPQKEHEMYGKDYVVKRLGMTGRYYSFDKKGWHFIVLDSNNQNAGSLDAEQRTWLENDLGTVPSEKHILIMSHYPLLAACTHFDGGGMHTDFKYLSDLFYQHKNKIKTCISGHIHLLDQVVYNDVKYFCNGAMSGFWWEEGDKNSAAKGFYLQTPPGYAIIDLFEDGTIENTYYRHSY